MIALIILTFYIMCLYVGLIAYNRLFNHISIYSTIWTLILCMGEIRLINYYPLETETWIIIFSAWILFVFGSLTYFFAREYAGKNSSVLHTYSLSEVSNSTLRKIIFFLSIASLVSAIAQWLVLLSKYGSIAKVLIYGNLIYSSRVYEGGITSIPYVDSLALAGCFFAGIYVFHKKSITLLSLFPLLSVIIVAIAGMGRAKILIALILFLTGFLLQKIVVMKSQKLKKYSLKKIFGFAVVFLIIIGSAEIIRSNRGSIESFSGASQSLKKLRGSAIITPSIYVYFSIHPFVFNEYLKSTGEHEIIGGNTFAPIWRIVDKVGFDTHISEYQTHYQTPVSSNTGSYLRELHADFGLSGVLIVPYLLGMVCSFYWFRWKDKKKLVDLAILSHLYVIVALSYLVIATRLGYWIVSLVTAIACAWILDRNVANKIQPKEFKHG